MLRSAPAKLFALSLAAVVSLPSWAEGPSFSLAEAPSVSCRDLVILPAPVSTEAGSGPIPLFRFLPDGPWLSLSKPLELSAAPGEERYYTLETKARGEGDAAVRRRTVLIDKRPPAPPRLEPPSGLYRASQPLALAAESGSTIRYALFSPGEESASFLVYDPARPPRLELPSSSASYILLSYAVDEAGNRSAVAKREYRFAPAGLAFAAPPPDASPSAIVPDTLSDLASPKLYSTRGLAELSFTAPRGSKILAAVNPPSPPSSAGDFLPLAAEGQAARLALSCPYGWSGKLSLYIALASESGLRYSSSPITVSLSNLPAPPVPEDPLILSGPSGGPAFLAFPSYQGRIRYAVGGGPEKDYESPVLVDMASGDFDISWRGLDAAGAESEGKSKRLSLPPRLSRLVLTGAAEGEWRNEAVKLVPSGQGSIRYEISMDGSLPPEPGQSSPLLGDSLVVDCPAGEEKACVIRYRSFSSPGQDAVADEGALLSFHLDKKAPEAPRLSAPIPAFSTKSLEVGLESAEGDIFALVEASGEASGEAPGDSPATSSAGFAKVEGPIELSGSREKPLAYRLRAYAVDRAGNRSAEMAPALCVVDLATVHVAASGGDSGDGGKERPLASLDAGLALARREGRKTILISGDVPLAAPIALDGGDLIIIGGFSPDWEAAAGSRSAIVPAFSSGKRALVSLEGGSLSLSKLELGLGSADFPALLSARNASLSISDSRLALSSSADILAIDLERAAFRLSGSELVMEAGRSGSMISGRDSAVRIENSRLAAGPGVRYYGALGLEGGSLELASSSFESSASLGTRLVSLSSSRISADFCLFRVSGGTGFLSVGKFESSPGAIANSRFLLDWKGGDATLFRSTGPCPSFIFDSLKASSAGALRFFECDGAPPVIGNSIVDCLAPKGELVVSRNAPKPGELFSSCLWGFQAYYLGGKVIRDIGELARFGSQAAAGKPCFVEAPAQTFAGAEPGSFALNPSSRCVDGGTAVPGHSADYSGGPRSKGSGPDIGSDEL